MASPVTIRSVSGMTKHPSGTTPDEAIVSVSDLRMRYGEREALAGLSFEVSRGELFALQHQRQARPGLSQQVLLLDDQRGCGHRHYRHREPQPCDAAVVRVHELSVKGPGRP